MRWGLPLLALLLTACPSKPGDTGEGPVGPAEEDRDGDGYSSREDCDDEDPAVHPGAEERCNGVDDDCDGYVDDDDPNVQESNTWYADGDGDGWGRDDTTAESCDAPSGYAASGGDCDDRDAAIHPGAEEHCDGVDEDCDGQVDDDPVDGGTWYADGDGDGFGDAGAPQRACAQPSGHVTDAADCDDGDPLIFPGAPERCNGEDDDCDGAVDEEPADPPLWYHDDDGDGFGDAEDATGACEPPADHVADASDCDDDDPQVFPEADERCNGVDDDCDGTVDEEPVDGGTWYLDADGDGFGDPRAFTSSCIEPSGYVADATDCDDASAAVFPGADELCNGVDDDCDGAVDEAGAVDAPTWYADADGDGYGDAASATASCTQPTGTTVDGSDCDDRDAAIHPGASEHCDGVDEDCDGVVDEGAVDGGTWYSDADGDGYGDPASPTTGCSQPTGSVVDSSDCDDTYAYSYPGAAELCDGLDNDCDGTVDRSGLATWFDSGGTPSDYSAALATGTPSAATTVGFTMDGTLSLCAGTWYLRLEVSASDFALLGAGSGSTVLDGDSTASVIQAYTGASVLTLEGLTLTGGGGNYGGGIDGSTHALDVTLDDVVIRGCTASSDGGGIYLVNSLLEATDLVLDANAATSSGGGAYLYGVTTEIEGLTVTSNAAGYLGGGVYLGASTAVIDDAVIAGNQGQYGGGLGLYYASASLTDADVGGNVATYWGGGGYVYASAIALASSRVYGNQAYPGTYSGAGGGLLAYYYSSITCTGSASETAGIYGNSAYYGGGVYLYDYYSTVVSSACDWGTSAAGDDNWYGDVSSSFFWGYGVGTDASFTCSGYGCY